MHQCPIAPHGSETYKVIKVSKPNGRMPQNNTALAERFGYDGREFHVGWYLLN
jgi:hypothetical protein